MRNTSEQRNGKGYAKTDIRFWMGVLFKPKYTDADRRIEAKNWSVRIQYQGNRRAFSLGTPKQAAAAARAKDIYLHLHANGDHPDGYLSYSADGRMYAIGVAGDRPKPLDLVPTDEEQVKLQESMFTYAGTYTVDGEKLVHHVDISWNQSWTGTDLVRFYKLEGNTLTITTARDRSATDGEEGEFILVWDKVH